MFRLKRVKVVLAKDGRMLALVGVDVQGPGKYGRVLLARPGETRDVWDKAVWISCRDFYREPSRGPVSNEDDLRFMPWNSEERQRGIGPRFNRETRTRREAERIIRKRGQRRTVKA